MCGGVPTARWGGACAVGRGHALTGQATDFTIGFGVVVGRGCATDGVI